MLRKTVAFLIAALLVAALIPVSTVSAQFQEAYITFTNLDEEACTPGDYPVLSFDWGIPFGSDWPYYHIWTLTNGRTGSFTEWVVGPLSSGVFVETGIIIETAVPAGTEPGDTLTLRADVIIDFGEGTEPVAFDTISWTCSGVAVPGCDTVMPIKADSVVGAFTANAQTYWKPGQLTNPIVTIGAGNTAWVLGKDATGAYYKIIWVCDLLWVPVGTMGPNNDAVWLGKPLPTGVVE